MYSRTDAEQLQKKKRKRKILYSDTDTDQVKNKKFYITFILWDDCWFLPTWHFFQEKKSHSKEFFIFSEKHFLILKNGYCKKKVITAFHTSG